MPSLIDQLARRLDTSPEQARKRLRTFLAALRSRTERNGHASLPGLGTFSREGDAWSFEPDRALARAVNRSFEDLDPVGVPAEAADAPPSPDADRRDAEGASAGASTVRTVSIFDAGEEDTAESAPASGRGVFDLESFDEPPSEADEATDRSAAETSSAMPASPARARAKTEGGDDLFAGISFGEENTDDTPAPPPPQTEETASDDAPEANAPPEDDAPPDDVESDWALSEPSASSDAAASTPRPSWNYAALPMGYLVDRRTATPAPADLRASQLFSAEGDPLSSSDAPTPPEEPPSGPDRSSPSSPAPDRSAEASDASPTQPADDDDARRRAASSEDPSSGGGWSVMGGIAALLVLAALGLGVWYVLGPQGAGSSGTGSSDDEAGNAPSERRVSAGAATAAADSAAPGAPPDAAAADTAAAAASPTAAADSSAGSAYARAERLDPEQGGWTIVVASKTSRDSAASTARRFAQQFEAQGYPIDIREATVDGEARYRVVVGQFSSLEEASGMLEQSGDRFPQGAWNLELASSSSSDS